MIATRTASPGTPDAAPERTAGSNVLDYYEPLRKHWAMVLSASALAAGVALLYSKSLPRIYEASSMLEIDPHATQPLGEKTNDVLALGVTGLDNREYYETQYKIMASNRVVGAVVRTEGLAHDADFLARNGLSGRPPKDEELTDALRKHMVVVPVKLSGLVLINVEDTDPQRAKRLCDALANAYIDQNLQRAVGSTADAVVWLNTQLDHVKGELESDENALYAFKQHNDLPSISINEASNMLRVEMQEIDTTLMRTRTKHAELAARQAELTAISPDTPNTLPSSEFLGSEFLQGARKQYLQAVEDRASLIAKGEGKSHPLVLQADEKVSESGKALLDEVRNIQGAVTRDLAVTTREEASESGMFEATRRRAVDLSVKEIEYHRLDRSREQNEKLYAMLLEHLKEADLARMMRANNIRVVDAATEPMLPIRPRIPLNVALGAFVGLLFGFVLAWLREQLDSSIKTPGDVESYLQTSFLGLLPELADDTAPRNGRRAGGRRKRPSADKDAQPVELSVHAHPLSGVAEAARSIRTNIMFMNPDRPHRKLLVTSAAPTEGKTTVACSIAIALAQGGQRVCIVDADLRRPRLHRIFDRVGDVGVTNFLLGEATLDDVAKPTVVENLWSIPAGPIPPNPGDILHSERFRQFVTELGERFDRVIIDSPPIVAVTDSAIISTLVDGIIFVVRALHTSKHLSAQGLRTLRDVDAPLLGVVLNAVNLSQRKYSYYYSSYYAYKRDGYRSPTVPDEIPVPRSHDDEVGSAPH